jgi:hypothetical protein
MKTNKEKMRRSEKKCEKRGRDKSETEKASTV